MEISIGDYVLTGGELPAAILVDSIVRLLPGAVSNESAALSDSFQDGLLGHQIIQGQKNLIIGKFQIYFYLVIKKK